MQRKMDKEELKDFIFMAVQAGKKETSDLVKDIQDKVLKMISEKITEQINMTVNGKIDRLREENRVFHTRQEEENRDKFLKLDEILQKLNERTEPLENTRTWFRLTKDWAIYWSGIVTPLIIIGGAIMWILGKIK